MRKITLAALALLFVIALTAVLTVRSRLANDRIKSTLETQASDAIGEPVHIGTLDVRWFPRPGLTLGQVTVGATRTLSIERLVLSTGLRPLLSGHIAEASVLIEHSRLDAPRFFSLVTAPPQASRQARGSALPLTIDAVRSIGLRDVALTSGQRTITVDADLAYAADGLKIERLDARSDISDLHASGDIKDLRARAGTLTIAAASLDLDALIEFMAPFGSSAASSPSSPSSPLDITVALTAKSGRAVGAAFSNLSAACRVTNGRVTLDKLRLSLFGGSFDGNVLVRTNLATPSYEWRGAFSGIDVPRLMEFAGAKGTMTGTLGGRMSLSASGTSVAGAFATAGGTAQVSVENGRVPGLEVVRTVILAFGRPSSERPAGSGEEFRQLAATLTIGGGRASTRNLTFASRDFDMTGQGWIDLRSQALAFDVDLVLSRELSAQAGRDLYRYASEEGRIVLPGRITGTAANPSVTIDVADALKRALQNTIKSRAKSWLDRIIR